MNSKIIIPIIVIIVSAAAIYLIPEDSSMPSSENLYQSGFTFYDVEKIKTSLSEENTPKGILIIEKSVPWYSIQNFRFIIIIFYR